METRQCLDSDTGEILQPSECGQDLYSETHGCLIDLCWNDVIQRRGQFGNPVDYFYRGLDEYVAGFGDIGEKKESYFPLEQKG